MRELVGTYINGRGIASGQNIPSPWKGTLELQQEAIKEIDHPDAIAVLKILETCFCGTINIQFTQIEARPDWLYLLPNVTWFKEIAPENLHFHPITMIANDISYKAFWYMGARNLHGNMTAEILAPWIDGLVVDVSQIKIQLED
ncbi:hypothetical protein [Curvivirga sp.]|uniref:hypothetical protein n=1 Tax=Curvivirga sp. TaxID=2856848 RepID=UPI003B5A595F